MGILKTKSVLGITYPEYHKTVENLLSEGKTSGTNHSEAMIQYTKMNLQRMNRNLKTVNIDQEIEQIVKSIERPLTFLVLAEAWCGDVAQNLPVIHKIVDLNPNWTISIVWRDENMDLMNGYLTNGSISIPKVIICDAESGAELAVWGPRPAPCQQMVMDYKKDPQGVAYMDFVESVHLWYAKDKGRTLQEEWKTMLKGLGL